MNAEEVAERIREGARRGRVAMPASIQAVADAAFLESAHDVYHVDLGSSRPLLGRLTLLAKHAVRRLLAPVLARQIEFNAAVARLARHTEEELEAIAERQDELRALLAAQGEQLRALRDTLEAPARPGDQSTRP